MHPSLTLAPPSPSHRARVEEIVRASKAFSEAEVEVALDVFDEGVGSGEWGVERDEFSVLPTPDSQLPSSYRLLGAFDGDELLGYACYGATPGTEGTFDLYWIAVHPDAQSGGVGTLLLHEVEQKLEALEARLLVVETSSRSEYTPTRGFYGRRGYAESARVREFYAPGDDRIILTKRFHSPRLGGEQRHHE